MTTEQLEQARDILARAGEIQKNIWFAEERIKELDHKCTEVAWNAISYALNSEQRAMVVNLAKANLNERLERLQEELKTL